MSAKTFQLTKKRALIASLAFCVTRSVLLVLTNFDFAPRAPHPTKRNTCSLINLPLKAPHSTTEPLMGAEDGSIHNFI